MLDLAKDFGISDVALAKRCKRLAIPLPGRGYWARVDAGQKPYRPKLPKREAKWSDQNALTMRPQRSITQLDESDAAPTSVSQDSLRDRIAALSIPPAESIMDCVAAVRRTARQLKHPRRGEFIFDRGERTGSIVSMDVSDGVLDRACLLADRILRSCESLGWSHTVPARIKSDVDQVNGRTTDPAPKVASQSSPLQINVLGERIGLHIEERTRDEPRDPTPAELAREKREYWYHAPRKVQVPTGNLRVVRLDTYHTYGAPSRLTWYDRGSKRVEEQIPDILVGFFDLAQSIKMRRAEDERRELAHQEAERRRKALEARQEANSALIKQLETDAGAWYRARYLRRYIRAARKVLGTETIHARLGSHSIDYLKWAETYVDQLDPLNSQERSIEFAERMSYYVNERDLKETHARLLGSEWEDSWKLGASYAPDPDHYYHSKSVFELEGTDDEATE